MAEICLQLRVRNPAQVRGDLELLAQAAKTSAEFRQLLLDLGELAAHLRCIQCKDLPSVSAGEVLLDLEFSDELAGLVSAVRAGDFDA